MLEVPCCRKSVELQHISLLQVPWTKLKLGSKRNSPRESYSAESSKTLDDSIDRSKFSARVWLTVNSTQLNTAPHRTASHHTFLAANPPHLMDQRERRGNNTERSQIRRTHPWPEACDLSPCAPSAFHASLHLSAGHTNAFSRPPSYPCLIC